MKQFIYILLACLFTLTGCDNKEPGYGYKEPVVYFSRAGIHNITLSGNQIPVSVYCSGNPDREAVDISAAVDRALYETFTKKGEFQLVPEAFYTTSSWTVSIQKKEQQGLFSVPIQLSSLSKGKYVLPLKLTNSSPFGILKGKDVLYITFTIE